MRAWHICGGQRTTSWSLFLPSILWGQPRAASASHLNAAPSHLPGFRAVVLRRYMSSEGAGEGHSLFFHVGPDLKSFIHLSLSFSSLPLTFVHGQPLLLNCPPLGHHQLQEYPLLLEMEVFIGFGPHKVLFHIIWKQRGPCGSGAALLGAGVESSTDNQPRAGGAGAGRRKPRRTWARVSEKQMQSLRMPAVFRAQVHPHTFRGNKQNTKPLVSFH